MFCRVLWLSCFLVAALGCAEETPAEPSDPSDCRNDGVGCPDGEDCRATDDEQFECIPMSQPDAAMEDAAPDGCSDGLKNGDETDADCGGTVCGACADDFECLVDGDCSSGHCNSAGICRTPSCTDGELNGGESDLDCGGPDCDACGDGLTCSGAGDCLSGVCTDALCQMPTCQDGAANASETDVDCGGPDCAACDDDAVCQMPGDCLSQVCADGACATARCGDGVINTDEVCDDGNDVTETCVYAEPECTVCASDCTEQAGALRACGDGVVDPEEGCDDGNLELEVCEYGLESCLVCGVGCTEVDGTPTFCGDGIPNGPESCDDANESPGDGCLSNCIEASARLCGERCEERGTVRELGARAIQQVSLLEASDDDGFGAALAFDGTRLFVGTTKDDERGFNSGSVTVFSPGGDRGDLEVSATLFAEDGAALDYFGASLALDDQTLIVGAYRDDDGGDESGSVYVFERAADGTYTQAQKLLASAGVANAQFGWSLAAAPGVLLVGAPGDAAGAVYVFTRNDGGPYQQHSVLRGADPTPGQGFGHAIALHGSTAVITAPGDRADEPQLGSVHVFNHDGPAGFSEQSRLNADDWGPDARFGASVSIRGEVIAVGASHAALGGPESGAVAVFGPDGAGGHVRTQILSSANLAERDLFGVSVAVSEELIVVGATQDDDRALDGGSAFAFTRDGAGLFVETAQLNADDAGVRDRFGSTLFLAGGQVFVAAPFNDVAAQEGGAVYAYELNGPICTDDGQCVCLEGADGRRCAGRPTCGDGVIQAAEECDEGEGNRDACDYGEQACTVCTDRCQPAAGHTSYCGDGQLDAENAEACDDGNRDDGDECTNSCGIARCGDGSVHRDEQCDDGNDIDDDGCSNTCIAPRCDDGVRNGDESAIDCGRSCERCAEGVACNGALDCHTWVCSDGVCQVPACDDAIQNGAETDTDCGGDCPACAVNQGCRLDTDCTSNICGNRVCMP